MEDNRVAKEQLRKSRTVHKEQERIIQMQMAHIDKYKEKLRDLREFKKSVEAEPVTRKQLEEAQRQLEERNRKIADLEKRIEVLELSSRVEVRGAKQAVATAKKEQAEAQAERDEIARELEERDRDLRAAKIQIKKLQGALLPLRMREHELRRGSARRVRRRPAAFLRSPIKRPRRPRRPAGLASVRWSAWRAFGPRWTSSSRSWTSPACCS